MEMFLMVAAMSLLGIVVSAVAFASATRETERAEPQLPPRDVPAWPVAASAFFAADEALPASAASGPAVPMEVLLLQIEQHVRLEQAAALTFHEMPTLEALHGRTVSPLVH